MAALERKGSAPSKLPASNPGPHELVERLSNRELEVLSLMAEGLSTKEIAEALGVAFGTAASHRQRVLEKVGVYTTVQAVRWAIRHGLIAA